MKIKDAHGVEQESKNKWLSLYMIGQIFHARGKPKQAIDSYEKVKDPFPDAKQAIARDAQRRYAFHRGAALLARPESASANPNL